MCFDCTSLYQAFPLLLQKIEFSSTCIVSNFLNKEKLENTRVVSMGKTSIPSDETFAVQLFSADCAKSLEGEAPCGSAIYGKVDEMSPAPYPLTPLTLPNSPPLDPPAPGPPLQKTRRTRKNQ